MAIKLPSLLIRCVGNKSKAATFEAHNDVLYLGDGAARIPLLDMVDGDDKLVESFYTTPIDQLPVGSKRFGTSKPLWVLTSKRTISGGEDMSTNFQAFKRGVIVEQDETTAGAANPITRLRQICVEEFGDWWTVVVPNLRPVHVVTGTGWEGVGVLSSIVAGKGEWQHVKDTKEVAMTLAIRE